MNEQHNAKQINTKPSQKYTTEEQAPFVSEEVSNPEQSKQISYNAYIVIVIFILFVCLCAMLAILINKNNAIKIEPMKHYNTNINIISYNQSYLQQLIKQMQTRPIDKTSQPTHKFKPTQNAYFAYSLHQNISNQHLAAQYYYYSSKYNLSSKQQYKQQLPICLVSVGHNLAFQSKYYKFLKSVNLLNYTNYKLILVDDASDDGTYEIIQQFLKEENQINFRVRDKIRLIRNQERMYALWNRNYVIRHYCGNDDIVVQLDPDDQFIGAQALKYISAVYHEADVWVFYSNYIYWSAVYGEPTQGISGKVPYKLLKDNTYRTSDTWFTSATRTFRQKLYTKINQSDFIDMNFPEYRADGSLNTQKYYKWCADLFMHYSLTELAGPLHYKYTNQIFYFYSLIHNQYQREHKKLDKYSSYLIRPYQHLQSLEDQPKRVQSVDGYFVPKWIQQLHKQALKQVEAIRHKP